MLEDIPSGFDIEDIALCPCRKVKAEIIDDPMDDGIVYELLLSKLISLDLEVKFYTRKPCCEGDGNPSNEVEYKRAMLCKDVNRKLWGG
jgi:hypothetical protein